MLDILDVIEQLGQAFVPRGWESFRLRCRESALNDENHPERAGCFGYTDISKQIHKGFLSGGIPLI